MPDTEPGTGDIMEIKTQFWSRKSSLVSEIIQIISNVLFILKFHDYFLFLYFYLLAEILFFYLIHSFHNCHSSEY